MPDCNPPRQFFVRSPVLSDSVKTSVIGAASASGKASKKACRKCSADVSRIRLPYLVLPARVTGLGIRHGGLVAFHPAWTYRAPIKLEPDQPGITLCYARKVLLQKGLTARRAGGRGGVREPPCDHITGASHCHLRTTRGDGSADYVLVAAPHLLASSGEILLVREVVYLAGRLRLCIGWCRCRGCEQFSWDW